MSVFFSFMAVHEKVRSVHLKRRDVMVFRRDSETPPTPTTLSPSSWDERVDVFSCDANRLFVLFVRSLSATKTTVIALSERPGVGVE